MGELRGTLNEKDMENSEKGGKMKGKIVTMQM